MWNTCENGERGECEIVRDLMCSCLGKHVLLILQICDEKKRYCGIV